MHLTYHDAEKVKIMHIITVVCYISSIIIMLLFDIRPGDFLYIRVMVQADRDDSIIELIAAMCNCMWLQESLWHPAECFYT